MTEKMSPETIWYLKKMLEISEKDFAEGRSYTHEQVKEMLKARKHEDQVVKACI
ncbi:MAG: hypothetical protein MJZ40_00270 [Bacteroidaceae bacterium]|nr:hypothetical protein [Bacteroidaceae bacterium]